MGGIKGHNGSTYWSRLCHALGEPLFQDDKDKFLDMDALVAVFRDTREVNGFLLFIGNGGSAGIAMHMTEDFLKNG